MTCVSHQAERRRPGGRLRLNAIRRKEWQERGERKYRDGRNKSESWNVIHYDLGIENGN